MNPQTRLLPALMITLAITLACGGSKVPRQITPAVEVPTSPPELPPPSWQAQQYFTFKNTWASLSSPLQLDPLGMDWREVVPGGYITTDADGQAKATNGNSCTVYVFQGSSLGMTQETISTCPRDSTSTNCSNASTWLVENCEGFSAVTLPATVTFEGTAVTLIEDRQLESVILIASEGTAHVAPSDPAMPGFDVHAGRAAYAVTLASLPRARAFFGFDPGEERDFADFVAPIEQMGESRQAASANSILLGQGLPGIPLTVPYALSLRWMDEKDDNTRTTQAIYMMVDWPATIEKYFPHKVAFFIVTQGQSVQIYPPPGTSGVGLVEIASPYDPKQGLALLDLAEIPPGQEFILAYDASIPDLGGLAGSIAEQLSIDGRIVVTPQPIEPDTAGSMFIELQQKGIPVIVLGGF